MGLADLLRYKFLLVNSTNVTTSSFEKRKNKIQLKKVKLIPYTIKVSRTFDKLHIHGLYITILMFDSTII